MKYIFLSILSILLNQWLFGQINNVNIIPPINNIADTGMLNVSAAVTPGDYEIATVVATIENRIDTLIYNAQSGHFEGAVFLAGLPIGNTYILSVTATDIMNNHRTDTVQILIDPPPAITIQLPADNEVASPQLHIKAFASDNLDCSLVVRVGLIDLANSNYDWQVFRTTFINAVDTVIDLSDYRYQGLKGNISFTVIDSRGQQKTIYSNIFVESSPYLEKVFSTDGLINDFNYGKVLSYFGESKNGRIVNINTNLASEIPSAISVYSSLTPTGAIFLTNNDYQVRDWNNDSLYVLGPGGTSSFEVAGSYAIWSSGFSGLNLYLRNTATASTKLISAVAGNSDNSVASNGTVAYWANDFNIFKHANDTSVRITTGGGLYPLTDGKLIAYSGGGGVSLFDGLTNTLLSTTSASHDNAYRVTNGFVAYAKTGTSGQNQIWLRDTTGVSSQITFFSNSSSLGELAPNGNICFSRSSLRYLYDKNSNKLKAISTSLGKTYYRDSAWYISIGRTLFKVNPNFMNSAYSIKNGNWSDPAIWYGNVVPPTGSDVVLRNNVTVDINVTCNSLTISNHGFVTVSQGISLTVLH